MKLIGKIHKFNTGRYYGDNKQPIDWGIICKDDDKQVVVFIDRARHIDGIIDIHFGNLDLIHNDWVLNAYDHYHYYMGSSVNSPISFFEDLVKNETI